MLKSRISEKISGDFQTHNAYADMLRFRDAHPGTFYRKLAKRNNIESTFSAIKARFGGAVRAIKRPYRAIELMSMAICYNITVR